MSIPLSSQFNLGLSRAIGPGTHALLLGTRNLINLIHQTKRPDSRFLFCSSIASVLGGPSSFETVTENWSDDPSTASPIGYSQSKWVTEAICHRANQQPGIESDSPRGRVQVLRIGQLCGDTLGGYWNEKEGWPLLLRTAETTGSLPLLTEVSTFSPDRTWDYSESGTDGLATFMVTRRSSFQGHVRLLDPHLPSQLFVKYRNNKRLTEL
jgi:thioester reductase-like protein